MVLQKSLKEGFGLTVAEALWKGRPVIASAVGGIPLQIAHKYSGILTRSIEGTVFYLKRLLNEPEYARKLGLNGREHIKNNFLITRHLRDYFTHAPLPGKPRGAGAHRLKEATYALDSGTPGKTWSASAWAG